MTKYILLLVLLTSALSSFSQSKRKQIEELQRRNDSLMIANETLSVENAELSKTIEHRKERIASQMETIKKIGKQREELRYEIRVLKDATYKLQEKVERLEPKVEPKEEKPDSRNLQNRNGFPYDDKGNGGSGAPMGQGSGDNPFGDGGMSSSETGVGCYGPDMGLESDSERTRLNNVSVENIRIDEEASIYYKLVVDTNGNVVAFNFLKSKTTTTTMTLINKIGVAIKDQVKYNKVEDAPLTYQFYTIHVIPN